MLSSQSLNDIDTLQADFDTLLLEDDLSDLSSDESLASPLSPVSSSRRSKELDLAETEEERRGHVLGSMPSKRKQLEALEHCIRLLSSSERPVIISATGARIQI
ncbi:hypothetical protein GUITHDRAFT_113923 [Guillardia theta CCMP2712]|uniref:Uncharacterized protein n=1 Tax=Guillardia theta (strain CCMP2712) TaxID=905079 RepID=L1IUJ8_GUITC|nr:hypothetical protein GUITHDRAFT_113923 [Guillardia theta CCMP2712]EKX39931.1 hypothetical protein GUITHDRAFT_113923 [Guillardia theta CCMP2712]|eukprot:XP_005826911.1 hypothetical protein GUITHDRAFT_113923 [Guillardia theta CCMP2712]